MFSLFGGSNSGKKEAKKTNAADPIATLQKLNSQVACIEKKEQVLQIKLKDLVKEALTNKKANNQKGAIFALRKKKLYEQELGKLDGMKFMLEQQKMALESSSIDESVFRELKNSNDIVKEQSKKVSVEALEELKDSMEEQSALRNEISEFFGQAAALDDPELENELANLDASAASQFDMKNFDQIKVPQGNILNKPAPSKVNPSKQEMDELRELEALMN